MLIRQKIIAIIVSLSIFVSIIYLVREKKLKEEYSWLWLMVGTVILLLSFEYELLLFLTELIGAVLPTSTIFFFGLIFLVLICLQFSTRISQLTMQHKNLVQKISIMDNELEKLREEISRDT